MRKCADVEVRKELVVLYNILRKKGIIDEKDLEDMGKGISRF
jgi:hypothetical protein